MKAKSLRKLAWLTTLVAGPSFANIVSNGSFEEGLFAPASYETAALAPGSTAVAGWEVIHGGTAWIGAGNPWSVTAQDGDRQMDLTGFDVGPLGGIRQTLITTPGVTYVVSFCLGSSNYYGGSALAVSAAGQSTTFESAPAVGYSIWQAFSFNFVAAGPTTDLSFVGVLGPGYIGLDNVDVTAVPEPGTLALCLTAGGLLGTSRLRRRRLGQVGGSSRGLTTQGAAAEGVPAPRPTAHWRAAWPQMTAVSSKRHSFPDLTSPATL